MNIRHFTIITKRICRLTGFIHIWQFIEHFEFLSIIHFVKKLCHIKLFETNWKKHDPQRNMCISKTQIHWLLSLLDIMAFVKYGDRLSSKKLWIFWDHWNFYWFYVYKQRKFDELHSTDHQVYGLYQWYEWYISETNDETSLSVKVHAYCVMRAVWKWLGIQESRSYWFVEFCERW